MRQAGGGLDMTMGLFLAFDYSRIQIPRQKITKFSQVLPLALENTPLFPVPHRSPVES